MWTAHPGGEQGDGERFLEPVARSASDRTIIRMYWKRCPSISLRTAAISGSTALAVRRTSDTTRPAAQVRRCLWQARGVSNPEISGFRYQSPHRYRRYGEEFLYDEDFSACDEQNFTGSRKPARMIPGGVFKAKRQVRHIRGWCDLCDGGGSWAE